MSKGTGKRRYQCQKFERRPSSLFGFIHYFLALSNLKEPNNIVQLAYKVSSEWIAFHIKKKWISNPFDSFSFITSCSQHLRASKKKKNLSFCVAHLACSELHMQNRINFALKRENCIWKGSSLPLRAACSQHLLMCARDFSFGTRCALGSDAQRSEVCVTKS